MSGAAERSSRWSEAEKIALLISVINSSGAKPTWSNVAVPAGRTTGTCQKQFAELLKAASGITMQGGADITPAAKRNTKPKIPKAEVDENGEPVATPTKKRGRPKAGNGDGDEGTLTKKPRGRKPKKAAESPAEDEEETPVKPKQEDESNEDMDGIGQQGQSQCEVDVAA